MHTKESESGTLETFTTTKIHNTNGKMPQEEPTCYVVVMKEEQNTATIQFSDSLRVVVRNLMSNHFELCI